MSSPQGHLLEVFSSYQGEGPYAGLKQVFVRLSGCHLRCVYCDTPESWERAGSWTTRGTARRNPVSVEDTLDAIRSFGPHPSVSITGGEPVIQAEFVRDLALGIRKLGMSTYLDTSGTLSDRLAVCAGAIDVFAFDVKLPSCPGVRVDADDVRRCLDLARGREAFVKIVVLKDTPPEDLTWAAGLVPEGMPLILQLATPVNAQTAPPDGETLARLRRACGREVAVMPQLHVLAGWK
ncbi:MAG TPA: 7-carboxy-7-deazaguanine synthase QueE [Planctomycetota bacterium]|nr:7-carboxy-7-deazaguanine synthase QueE [Planctomycetota bacterium]